MAVASQNTTLIKFLLRMRGDRMAADKIVLPVMKIPLQSMKECMQPEMEEARRQLSPGSPNDAQAEAQTNTKVCECEG